MIREFQRAKLFSSFCDQPIMAIKNVFGVDEDDTMWVVLLDYKLYNPSNHIHQIELNKCKDVTKMVEGNEEFSADSFNTRLDNIPVVNLVFSNSIQWIKIR